MKKQISHLFKEYKKKLFKKIIQSRFLKTQVNFLFIMCLTMILQLYVNIILCYLLMIGPYVDFFIQIILTIIIGFYTKYFLKFVLLFEKYIYNVTRYFIHNYSFENYRIWKRNLIISVCGLFILILFFYELNKIQIILQIIQTVISFLILDQIQALPKEVPRIKTQKVIDPINNSTTYIKLYQKGDLKIKRE